MAPVVDAEIEGVEMDSIMRIMSSQGSHSLIERSE